MALSDAQKADVRLFLGWTDMFAEDLNPALERALNGVATRPETETHVIELIAECAAVRTELISARSRLKATAVGTINLDGAKEIKILRSEGKRMAASLSKLLGVPLIKGGYFGPSGRSQSHFGYGIFGEVRSRY